MRIRKVPTLASSQKTHFPQSFFVLTSLSSQPAYGLTNPRSAEEGRIYPKKPYALLLKSARPVLVDLASYQPMDGDLNPRMKPMQLPGLVDDGCHGLPVKGDLAHKPTDKIVKIFISITNRKTGPWVSKG